MPNTTATIKYSNGSTREFVASDELEKLIDEGQMFSVTTMHSDISIDEEISVSKMYAGNPVAAMGHMIMMRHNAEKILDDDDDDDDDDDTATDMNIVIDTLNACISLLSDEVTSHQSGMSKVLHEYQQAEGRIHRTGEKTPIINMMADHAGLSPVDSSAQFESSTLCKYFHVNKNVCLHKDNLDNSCMGYSICDAYLYVNDLEENGKPFKNKGRVTSLPDHEWKPADGSEILESNELIQEAVDTIEREGDVTALEYSDNEPCPATGECCDHYIYQYDRNNEVAIEHCTHPKNSSDYEGNCTSLLCPLLVQVDEASGD